VQRDRIYFWELKEISLLEHSQATLGGWFGRLCWFSTEELFLAMRAWIGLGFRDLLRNGGKVSCKYTRATIPLTPLNLAACCSYSGVGAPRNHNRAANRIAIFDFIRPLKRVGSQLSLLPQSSLPSNAITISFSSDKKHLFIEPVVISILHLIRVPAKERTSQTRTGWKKFSSSIIFVLWQHESHCSQTN
jgi:hypothetical protein